MDLSVPQSKEVPEFVLWDFFGDLLSLRLR